ncbi:MAG: outer membrane beta-barrel protein [Chitinophagaceae bacterium]|nr:outer membrane beta-barrel protein [Chitinophagaceae bacterium]
MLRILAILFLVPISSMSQQQVSLHLFGGFSNYSGDLQESRFTIDQSHVAFGLGLSYEVMPKVLIRASLVAGKLSANDKYSPKALNRQRNLNFTSPLYDASLVVDYSLFDLTEKKATPYAFAGLAIFGFNPYTFDSTGAKFYLRNLSTEGQGLPEYPDRKRYNNVQLSIPFGVGVRVKINDNTYLGYEIGMRKTFTDYLDDVSTKYVDRDFLLAARGPKAVELAFRSNELKDVNLPYPADGTVRGGPDFKDWYYFSGITLSIGLFTRNQASFFGGKGKRGSVDCPKAL